MEYTEKTNTLLALEEDILKVLDIWFLEASFQTAIQETANKNMKQQKSMYKLFHFSGALKLSDPQSYV